MLLGETATIHGHVVARVGLCGPAAYVVDGASVDLAAASARSSVKMASKPQPAVPKGKPQLRLITTEPELLGEVRAVLGDRRAFSATHRAFDGGEAVTVTVRDAAANRTTILRAAVAKLSSSGLYAEMGFDNASVVAAWSSAALHPKPAQQKAKKGSSK